MSRRIAEKPAIVPGDDDNARADIVALSLTKTVSTLLDRAIAIARDAMTARQHASGYWLFELEADCTIPAEYILMMHFLDEIDPLLEVKLAAYLRSHQMAHGGWPLYHGGDFNISCTVKAYYALKLAGDDIHAPHMVRARDRDSRARRRRSRERVHAHRARAVRADSLAWRALPSRRDHAAAEVVFLPPRQSIVLVAHGHGAAVHPLHAQAGREESAQRAHPRAVHDAAGAGAQLFSRHPQTGRLARARHAGGRAYLPPSRSPHFGEHTRAGDPAG